MPIFTYYAHDMNGRAVSGNATGINEHAVRRQLRQNGLYVTRLEAEKAASTGGGSLFAARVKLYDLVIFSRQLSTLVRAGLNLTEAFTALAEQTKNPTLRDIIQQMHADILGGSTFTDAIYKHRRVFSELYRALVAAGEVGGILPETLDTAAKALDTEMEIREKVKSAFVYPIAVAVVAVAVVTILLVVVVPVFANVYKQFNSKLPGITQMLIDVSVLVRSYWWLIALIDIAIIVACIRYNRTYTGRRFFDTVKTRLPLFGHLIEKIGLSRMAHTLAALTNSGVPLINSLITAGNVSNNSLVTDAVRDVVSEVQQGGELGRAMAATRRFPVIMTRMISAGEKSGDLPGMLEQVGVFFDRDVEYGIKRLMTLIEPIMTVIMGIIVGFILLALYLPIFNLGNVIRNH